MHVNPLWIKIINMIELFSVQVVCSKTLRDKITTAKRTNPGWQQKNLTGDLLFVSSKMVVLTYIEQTTNSIRAQIFTYSSDLLPKVTLCKRCNCKSNWLSRDKRMGKLKPHCCFSKYIACKTHTRGTEVLSHVTHIYSFIFLQTRRNILRDYKFWRP